MLTNEEVLEIFENAGALLHGHFLLASGYHSEAYLEKFQVLQYPEYVERLCSEIARRFADKGVEVVLGPTTGGVLLAYEVAKNLKTRGIFAERRENGTGRELRRGFHIRPNERVLIVDDILTSGGSVRETIDVVRNANGNLIGIAVLADRSNGTTDFGVPLESLLKIDIERFAPDSVPDWLAAIPITERGTSNLMRKT